MRRLIPLLASALLIACLALAPAGCKRKRRAVAAQTDDRMFASMINVADPRSKTQLVKGFYDVEAGAWRWTARQFDVVLRPPRGANQKGALLLLRFSIPDVVIQKLKSMTLTATVNGKNFAPETYTTAGEFTYLRELPPSALGPENVPVSFTLDKALPGDSVDSRELGVIVKEVGFELK